MIAPLKRRLLFSVLIIIFTSPLYAQYSFEIGGFAGAAMYQGDLAESHIEFKESRLSKGFFFRFNLNPNLSLRAAYTNGTVKGNDANSTSRKERDWEFTGTVNEFGFIGEYYPIPQSLQSTSNNHKSIFVPYLFGGVAYARIDAILKVPEDDKVLFPESSDKDLFLVIPVGGGIKGIISKYTTLGLEFGWRITFSDYIDDVSVNGGKEKNDWYSFVGLNFSVLFNKQRFGN